MNRLLDCCKKLFLTMFLLLSHGCFVADVPEPEKSPAPLSLKQLIDNGVNYLREYDRGNIEALEKANASFQLASQVAPESAEVYDGLGCVALREGRNDSANEFFNRALASNPSYSRAWVHKAYIEEIKGNNELAMKYLRKSFKTNPYDVHALNNLAGMIVDYSGNNIKEKKEASSLIHRAMELDKSKAEILKDNLNIIKNRR